MRQAHTGMTRNGWLIVAMFALLVGMSFFARHLAGSALFGTAYNALDWNANGLATKTAGPFTTRPNNLLWDETFGYARYVRQMQRGDWSGNTFETYANYAQAGTAAPAPAHYPFFFDRGGVAAVTLLAQLTGDVSRAFALSDLLFPLLIALLGVLFCLQLRPSLAFALLATACFVWFNWSDSATWLSVLRNNNVPDGMVFSRTPYPQLAMVTFLAFAIVFVRAQKTPTPLWSILLSLTLVLNAFTYVYSWLLALAVTGVTLLLFLIQKPLALEIKRNFFLACAGALAAGLFLSAPVWAAYLMSPDLARDVVGRFAQEEVTTPDILTRTLILIALALPLTLPWLRHMSSRVFWLAFWIGGIAAYNQHLITGIMVQPAHYPPYYMGTFAAIYLIDLALSLWERLTPPLYARWSPNVLTVLAVVVVLGGFAAITWRMANLARVQADYNRMDASTSELVSTLNRLDGDYIVLTTDDYLHRLLPAYVARRFVLPVFTDPLTNDEMTTVQNAAARLMGYADWKAWETNKASTPANTAGWSLDVNKVLLVVNRHRAEKAPAQFSRVVLENQDYIVGIGPVK